MPLLIVTVIVQACFILHVFKTGRPYWWAYVILGFPVAGCVIYYFIEVFPGSREHRSAHRLSRSIGHALNPDKELRRCKEQLEISPTVQNRVALAEELLRHGAAEDAVALYRQARSGPYANDPQLAFGMASALIAHQELTQARTLIKELIATHPAFRPDAVMLLLARVLEGLGHNQEALAQYERAAEHQVGLEAKVRYAQLLKRMGYAAQAHSLLQEVI